MKLPLGTLEEESPTEVNKRRSSAPNWRIKYGLISPEAKTQDIELSEDDVDEDTPFSIKAYNN
jgi:hypothetical protein